MRNPANVLNSLCKHSRSDYKFERLYRILFNTEMYYVAYQRIYSKEGNMTKGVDGQTIDGMSISRIEQLIEALKNESYQPVPSKRVYIPKKNGKKRPLGIPSFKDKLVQEVVRMILSAIYEGSFEHTSHGFRPERSCHTALISVQKTFTAVKWFIEGDIKGFYDNIDHDVLIAILRERIADERFLRLIRKFLNAGYVEDWVFHRTYSGTPQGGIVSPILANIYLDKFDKYMKAYANQFNKGVQRRENPVVMALSQKKCRLCKKLKNENDETVKEQLRKQISGIVHERRKYPATIEMDSNFKRLKYVRYADDFLIGIIGSKEDSQRVKEDIKTYFTKTLKLELSEEKTLITNARKPAKFLGFNVFTREANSARRNKNGDLVRTYGRKIVLNVAKETMRDKLQHYKSIYITVKKGREVWISRERTYIENYDDLEIISMYNAEIRGFYNYYSIANNSCSINSFYNIMEYSMYRTYASKYRTTMRKIMRKFTCNKEFRIPYVNKKGRTMYRNFYNDGFRRRKIVDVNVTDSFPNTASISNMRTSLIDRLRAGKCEFCGATNNLEIHHVRKLKDLKGKEEWEIKMISRKRKTLAVCSSCHHKIHNGKID